MLGRYRAVSSLGSLLFMYQVVSVLMSRSVTTPALMVGLLRRLFGEWLL